MVHPLMRQSASSEGEASDGKGNIEVDSERVSSPIIDMLSRLHVLVVGPGLGRDPLMQATVARVIRAARDRDMPVVLDADALLVIQKDPGLVKGYEGAVLTPNVVEFGRLCSALEIDAEEAKDSGGETAKVEALAKALEGVTVIQKGGKDYISNGTTTLVLDLEGGKKRSGGQGDTLTGAIATFLGWRKAYLDGLWDTGKDRLKAEEMVGLAAFGGSAITRVRASHLRDSISTISGEVPITDSGLSRSARG
jgi:ATP-dependent NAD(P)H-hydrate dehydratase